MYPVCTNNGSRWCREPQRANHRKKQHLPPSPGRGDPTPEGVRWICIVPPELLGRGDGWVRWLACLALASRTGYCCFIPPGFSRSPDRSHEVDANETELASPVHDESVVLGDGDYHPEEQGHPCPKAMQSISGSAPSRPVSGRDPGAGVRHRRPASVRASRAWSRPRRTCPSSNRGRRPDRARGD